jgi:hypothetical protein
MRSTGAVAPRSQALRPTLVFFAHLSSVTWKVRALRSVLVSANRTWQVLMLGSWLAVAGCAARPTGYVEARGSFEAPYGFSVSAMGSDEYSILVRANSLTTADRAAEIALLRAANLTIEKGGTQFKIIHSEGLSYPYDHINSVVFRGAYVPVSISSSEDKVAALVIHILLPESTSAAADAINAREVIASLSAKLQR